MHKSEAKMSYKEILKTEVNKIPEDDNKFMTQLITIIRKHLEKAGKQ